VVDPPTCPPDRQRLGCVHAKVIKFWVVAIATKFGFREPVRREFGGAVSHVLPAEYAKCEHLFGRKLRAESWVKTLSWWLRQHVDVALLHSIVDFNSQRSAIHHSDDHNRVLKGRLGLQLAYIVGCDRAL
jgi:hypothetical protein